MDLTFSHDVYLPSILALTPRALAYPNAFTKFNQQKYEIKELRAVVHETLDSGSQLV